MFLENPTSKGHQAYRGYREGALESREVANVVCKELTGNLEQADRYLGPVQRMIEELER